MEKQINLSYFLGEEKQPALGILGILRETFKTTIKNGKLVLSIAFFMFTCYSLLGLADHLISAPVWSDFASKYALKPKHVSLGEIDPTLYKAIIKDFRIILVIKLTILAFHSLFLLTSLAAVIHSTYEAYTAKASSFKEMLLSIKAGWKRPLITTFFTFLISMVSIILFLIVSGLMAVMTDGSLSIFLVMGLIIFGICVYVYLSALWTLSLVVSVLEENSSGMKAIERAMELIKGKTLQGCLLILILLLASFIMSAIFSLLDLNAQKSRLIGVAISVARTWSFCLEELLVFVAFTIFYYECRSHKVEDKTSAYATISAVEC